MALNQKLNRRKFLKTAGLAAGTAALAAVRAPPAAQPGAAPAAPAAPDAVKATEAPAAPAQQQRAPAHPNVLSMDHRPASVHHRIE